MTVLKFPDKVELDEHLSGEAKCMNCGHEWVSVQQLGVVHLDCPECETHKGVLKGFVQPETVWQCNCGSELFTIGEDRLYCAICGAEPILE